MVIASIKTVEVSKYFATIGYAYFDEETGTLTILGEGALNDIVNYYGGGSKKQPWFSYRKDIKKIVVGPKITYIGK